MNSKQAAQTYFSAEDYAELKNFVQSLPEKISLAGFIRNATLEKMRQANTSQTKPLTLENFKTPFVGINKFDDTALNTDHYLYGTPKKKTV